MQHLTSSATALLPSRSSAHQTPSTKSARSPLKSPTRSRRQLQAPKARRVLLVEEDQEQRFALKEQLARAGYQVTVALDDVSAAWSLSFCHFDAVVLDLGAPDSEMLAVLTEVGQSRLLPSVVIFTGGDDEQQNLALALGADLVLQKPCSVDSVTSALDYLPVA